MKFKVGDIVRGISGSPYRVTNEDMTKGVVVELEEFGYCENVMIKVLEHRTKPEEIEETFSVNSKYFELYDYNKIVITTDGNKTLARLYENNEVVRTAEAKCSPNFETGAKLAFERLIEKKDEFVPHLKSEVAGEFLGKIGAPTRMQDIAGRPLFVGDVVELILIKGLRIYGNRYIVEDCDKCFVMGIKSDCSVDGTIDDDWAVIKRKGYEELKNGEMHGSITAILEESK